MFLESYFLEPVFVKFEMQIILIGYVYVDRYGFRAWPLYERRGVFKVMPTHLY